MHCHQMMALAGLKNGCFVKHALLDKDGICRWLICSARKAPVYTTSKRQFAAITEEVLEVGILQWTQSYVDLWHGVDRHGWLHNVCKCAPPAGATEVACKISEGMPKT